MRTKSDRPYPGPTELPQQTPLNSVSTRIILCVFGSTLLTALIVSWLSVGAIHRDVRHRITSHSRALLDVRRVEIDSWHQAASDELASSTTIGASWHTALLDASELLEGESTGSLHWVARAVDGEDPAQVFDVPRPLPTPPSVLAEYFERISLHVSGDARDAASRAPLGCVAARTDLVRSGSGVVGYVEGCLSHEALFAFLQPAVGDSQGTRLLLVDQAGRIGAAAGARASTRRGQTLPIAGLLYPAGEDIASYTNPKGERLVGSITTLAVGGWHLVAESDYSAAFAPAIAITNQIFIVDICVILLFSVLAYQITAAIMKPIEALSEGARRISQGQVDYEIPLPANCADELGLLTRTFNDMMAKLRSNQTEIEEDHLRLGEKNEELQRANEILSQLSITDGLTKLHNHRYFQDHLTREIKRVSRTKTPLSLILIDIDDFKLLNDTHGHAAGDEVLIRLASIMNDSARESDLIARYGGEEFVILMPNTDLPGAVHLAEKIRMAVESTRLIIGDSMKPVDVTISLGVALFNGNRREFFGEADKALYQAKGQGKNCVVIAGADSSASL